MLVLPLLLVLVFLLLFVLVLVLLLLFMLVLVLLLLFMLLLLRLFTLVLQRLLLFMLVLLLHFPLDCTCRGGARGGGRLVEAVGRLLGSGGQDLAVLGRAVKACFGSCRQGSFGFRPRSAKPSPELNVLGCRYVAGRLDMCDRSRFAPYTAGT